MAYTYKYIPSSILAGAKKGTEPKQQYIDLFQQTLDEQFYNSSDWWTVQEETYAGSDEYENIDVRIAHVINAETGLKLGDDWKTILFREFSHDVELGKKYIFDDNTWIIINIESIKNIASTATVRRCNNTLRWIDEPTGAYYEEPCAIEYLVKEPRDYATQGSPFMTPGGYLHIEMQLNPISAKINENQRFLFGNPLHWTCYKVTGTGINDFRNMKTFDNSTAKILTLDLTANFINEETDDVVRGICDVYTNIYALTLSSASISGVPTDTFQLTPNVLYNGDSVIRDIEWNSSNTTIASVTGSGLVTLNTNGSCVITANIKENSASATCLVTVSPIPNINKEILINPNTNYVLEGLTETYSVYLYENNVQSSGSFVITCSGSNIPSTSYVFAQTDGNHFTISNILRNVNSYLTVTCTTGSVPASKNFIVYLRGAWQFDNI